jgi:hypothetical protein
MFLNRRAIEVLEFINVDRKNISCPPSAYDREGKGRKKQRGGFLPIPGLDPFSLMMGPMMKMF